jgi:chromosome partitioning protein
VRVVSVINQKGGVAKTTTCANVAACLAAKGKRTLLIDLDPQANLTMGIHADFSELPYGLHDFLLDARDRSLSQAIRQVGDMPLYLAPGHIRMAQCETAMIRDSSPDSLALYRLRHGLDQIRSLGRSGLFPAFDWVLIDCPPSLGPLTQSAIMASSHLLVPTEAKMYAFAGMDILNSMVQSMAARHSLDVGLLGVVITMFDRTKLHRAIETVIRERFGEKVFDTVIHKNVRISEAELEGRPVISFDKRAAGAKAYEALTDEVLSRVAAETDQRPA